MEKLIFNEEEHTYHVGEQELTSVTKFVSWFFPEFDKEQISQKVANNRGVTQEEVLDEWNEISSKGTLIHEEIERFVLGDVFLTEKKSFQGAKFCDKMLHTKENLFRPEWRVHSVELGLAGTIDLYVENKYEDLSFIYDWKTNEKLTEHGYGMGIRESTKNIPNSKLHKYYLQLNTYAYILNKEHGVELEDMMIVHLKEDGYEVIVVPNMLGDVEAMINEWGEHNEK